jgi:hypothetical protein
MARRASSFCPYLQLAGPRLLDSRFREQPIQRPAQVSGKDGFILLPPHMIPFLGLSKFCDAARETAVDHGLLYLALWEVGRLRHHADPLC